MEESSSYNPIFPFKLPMVICFHWGVVSLTRVRKGITKTTFGNRKGKSERLMRIAHVTGCSIDTLYTDGEIHINRVTLERTMPDNEQISHMYLYINDEQTNEMYNELRECLENPRKCLIVVRKKYNEKERRIAERWRLADDAH